LRRCIDQVLADEHRLLEMIGKGRQKLISSHMTQHRAEYLINRTGRCFSS
jgi:hypothetical protein